MLVLSRKVGERIKIGKDIWVEVIDIQHGKVRLGFSLPKTIPVMREELLPREEGFSAERK